MGATQLPLCDSGGALVTRLDQELSQEQLIGVAIGLGAGEVGDWSPAEKRLARAAARVPHSMVARIRREIGDGNDPLGMAFCRFRSSIERRKNGATYTPAPIVEAMFEPFAALAPERIVDPGTGSARFLLEAARRYPMARLLGIEIDPLPSILARANLAAAGFADRAQITLGDFRAVRLPRIPGKTLFIGNPPYVRHHRIEGGWKDWFANEAAKQGLCCSRLAGLHVHFLLATVAHAAPGDQGAFVTAAEWLDVNYGSTVREMFLGKLGGERIVVIEPTAMPFPDAATTAAITYFDVGSVPSKITLSRVATLGELANAEHCRTVDRARLAAERRWSHLTRPARKGPAGYVELGELCRVHRGQVTGANKLWIEGAHSANLPEAVLFPSVTKARELLRAGAVLGDASVLRRVIDLPADLDELEAAARRAVDKFLRHAKQLGAHLGYVATNRKAWWSVGLRAPAPILATYMARRPPAFVRNRANARHINIAHGIYPRQQLGEVALANLVSVLSSTVCLSSGRTYAGGLTKFEPREMERLMVPGLEMLVAGNDA